MLVQFYIIHKTTLHSIIGTYKHAKISNNQEVHTSCSMSAIKRCIYVYAHACACASAKSLCLNIQHNRLNASINNKETYEI